MGLAAKVKHIRLGVSYMVGHVVLVLCESQWWVGVHKCMCGFANELTCGGLG